MTLRERAEQVLIKHPEIRMRNTQFVGLIVSIESVLRDVVEACATVAEHCGDEWYKDMESQCRLHRDTIAAAIRGLKEEG